jgi:hypothetical protein
VNLAKLSHAKGANPSAWKQSRSALTIELDLNEKSGAAPCTALFPDTK